MRPPLSENSCCWTNTLSRYSFEGYSCGVSRGISFSPCAHWLGLVRFLLLIIKGDECVLAWKGRWITSAPADCRLLCEWSGRPCPCRKHWLLPRPLPTRWLSKGYICIIICLIGGLLPGYGPSLCAMESALNLLQRYEGRDYKACKLPAHGFLLPNLITVCANKHFSAYALFFL